MSQAELHALPLYNTVSQKKDQPILYINLTKSNVPNVVFGKQHREDIQMSTSPNECCYFTLGLSNEMLSILFYTTTSKLVEWKKTDRSISE